MELSYQRKDIKIQIRLELQIFHCYTCDEVDSTIILLEHPEIDFLVDFRCFSYTNTSWKL